MKEIMYRDDEGLENLIAQIEDYSITSKSIAKEKGNEGEGTIKLGVGLGGLLSAFGIAKAGVDAEATRKIHSNRIEKSNLRPLPETQYRSIINYLSGEGRIYKDPYKAWCATKSSSGHVFCDFEGLFIPSGWDANSEKWIKTANKQKTLVLFNYEDRSLIIGMSLSKMFGISNDQITPTSHLAMRARTGKMYIRVFGNMDKTKYIKPFFAVFS
ncbi:DUF6414 family protein [Magnetovibrio blakemorei]|uniref:DUF6414 family protein n=1 Tax=Magnetovibrio blakemorei TaxID=28181 RepID=UPI001112F8FE|nr:hypothetical protein [Magnetovibrio blakemorei]